MECCPACFWQIDYFRSLPHSQRCWRFLGLRQCCSAVDSSHVTLALETNSCHMFGFLDHLVFGMTMVLYLSLQKPLDHGLIVKVSGRLSMLPTIHRHLEFLSSGNFLCIVLCFLWQSFTKPSQKGLVHCSRVGSD